MRKWFFTILLSACAAGGTVTGDGTGSGTEPLPEGADPFELDPNSVENLTFRQNVVNRRAIFLGNILASDVFQEAMNTELSRLGAGFAYDDEAMTPGSERDAEVMLPEGATPISVTPTEPAGVEGASCAFAVQAPAVDASALDCRLLARNAQEDAMTRAVRRLADTPITGEFVVNAPNPVEVNDWYEEAFFFGLDQSPEIAIQALRNAGVCDQAPTQVQSAFERGVEAGRDAATRRIQAQEAMTPRTECNTDRGIVNPARNAVMGQVPQLVSENELCPGFVGTVDEELRLQTAGQELQDGIVQGIEEAARAESARLVRTWVCTPPVRQSGGDGGDGGGGDPLVLDLDGDGLHIEPIEYGALFDFGNGDGMVRSQWLYGDAFVVFDRDNDNEIVSTELFGDVTVTEDGETARDGMEALALYDAAERGGNEDGRIDSADAVYGELKLWTDINGDARSNESELATLEEAGVESIDFTNARYFVGGEERLAADVWFEYSRR